jgi:ubiquinol-cytochrome c reductase cytochrome b subunit
MRVDIEPLLRTTGGAIDDRFHAAGAGRRALGKAFPDHWSFFLGEIALYSFIILIITGIYLTLFFHPSNGDVVYHGTYLKLDGVRMSEAYESAITISFDIRGGLLLRQIHHWAALIFVASIAIHAMRIFFTGAFRKPREINWLIGTAMFAMAAVEGFCGYSLPDDLLSGTGLRIAEGIMLSIPIVGTYITFFFFGGQFPGQVFIPRLYILHVLLLPGLILALVTAHLMVIWHQGHTQWPGRRERDNVEVGVPTFPIFALKTTSLFIFVFAALALLGTVAQINPIWLFGPYVPVNASSAAQPDWYFGLLEGTLRLMPGVISNTGGYVWAWNVFIPAVLVPALFFVLMFAYPFFEQWVTGDRRPHQVLDRPRNAPTRTGLGVAIVTSGVIIELAGGDDVIAQHLYMSVEGLIWGLRVGFFVLPAVLFIFTRRACVAMQRADRRKLGTGVPFGLVSLPPDGAATAPEPGVVEPGVTAMPEPETSYTTVNRPLSGDERARLNARRPDELITPVPRHLVPLPTPRRAAAQLRARLNHYYLFPKLEPRSRNGGDSGGEPDGAGQGDGRRGRTEREAGPRRQLLSVPEFRKTACVSMNTLRVAAPPCGTY